MSGFLGTYADLRGKRVGRFLIDELVGRDASGAPRYRVICDVCCFPQSLSQARLGPLVQGKHSQITLLCRNIACPLSHHENQSETLADIRRQERQAELKAAEAQRAAAADNEKERRKAERADRIMREYLAYLNHQWRLGAADDNICKQSRWFTLSDVSRKAVVNAMEKNPTSPLLF